MIDHRAVFFNNLVLEAGEGFSPMPMTKGSFDYTDQVKNRRRFWLEKAEAGDVFTFTDNAGARITLTIRRTPGESAFLTLSCDDASLNRFWLTLPVPKEAHYYGAGETFAAFDLAGKRVRIWVAEHQSAARIEKKTQAILDGKSTENLFEFEDYESYYVQPTLSIAAPGLVSWLHVDTDAYCAFDLSEEGKIGFELREPCTIELRRAADWTDLSAQMADRFGHVRKLPDWVYDGVILGIQRGSEVVEEKLDACWKTGVPVTGVWCQDWCGCRKTAFGYQVMWNWSADESLYPHLKDQTDTWRRNGVHFLGYINPFMAIEGPLYRAAAEKGLLVKDTAGNDYLVTITTFPAAMIDLTNPEAWEWYKNVIRENLLGAGLDGWMADFGEYLPVDAVLYSGENAADVHNRWPAMWAKLNQEAIREAGREEDVFFFTRAGHTGTIAASAMMWTGDQHVDWSADDGLPSVIPATLSLAMSGYPMAHSDFGGYTTNDVMNRDRELLMRWEEMNALSPLMRGHEGNRPWANVQFDADKELLVHLGRCGKLHTAIAGYLKRLVAEAAEHGTPVMRPLFYHYDEPRAYTEDGEYLLGPDLLVAPVLAPGENTRTLWLPQDDWVHLFTWEHYTGGEVTVGAPIGQPPVFMRVGSDAFGVGVKLASKKA